MGADRYTAYVGSSLLLAEDVPYAVLLRRIVRFTAEAAVARCADDPRWEHEELRRRGLSVLALSCAGKALWSDPVIFESELNEARREGALTTFTAQNELDATMHERLDRDLRRLWREAGYDVPSLIHTMKELFVQLEADVNDTTAGARARFVDEIVPAID
jgi:hypothetical protein